MRTHTTTTRTRPGFTLIELLVVVAVILIIAGVLVAGLARTVGTARASTASRTIDALVLGVNQFKADFGFLPPLVHDGPAMATDSYEPIGLPSPSSEPTWPAIERNFNGITIDQLAVWSSDDGGSPSDHLAYSNFIRRRAGTGADAVRLPQGGLWDPDGAWDDRRYSKFALPYYLAGVGRRAIDGVEGPGMSRPLANGLFEGVLYRSVPGRGFGTTRDRTEPFVEAGRRSLRLVTGYLNRDDVAEHGAVAPPSADIPDSYAAFVDPWGRAYRYYRWEPGRFEFNRLVVETTLDLNIPPVLINPEVYGAVRNSDAAAADTDLTSGSAELRAARFAIVSAGENGVFGTEPVDLLAERLREPVPTTDGEIVRLRKLAWEDNLVGLGN